MLRQVAIQHLLHSEKVRRDPSLFRGYYALRGKIKVFNKADATHKKIATAGYFLLALYDCNMSDTLDMEEHENSCKAVDQVYI